MLPASVYSQTDKDVVALFYPASLITWSAAHPTYQIQRESGFIAVDLDGVGSAQYLAAAYGNGFVGALRLIKKTPSGPVLIAETKAFMGERGPVVEAIDIDGDGRPKLKVTYSTGGRSGNGYGWFFSWDGKALRSMNGASGKEAETPFLDPNLADVNGDGTLEIVSPSDPSDPDTTWNVDKLVNGTFTRTAEVLCFYVVAIRAKGEPFVQSDEFSATPGNYVVHVTNGDRGQKNVVDSGVVSINGTTLFGPNDFREKPRTLSAPVKLLPKNTVQIELRSAPGSTIYVFIEPAV